jgi:hypothetical protein
MFACLFFFVFADAATFLPEGEEKQRKAIN